VLAVAQVYALADAASPRYRALVLLACFCGLRWGELAALRRCDIDTEAGTVRVVRQLSEVNGRPPFFGPPKSCAGKRTVVMPPTILPDVSCHLASFTQPDADALAFTSPGRQAASAQ
jgi:integrase